jgi:hypothetical protein
VGEWSINYEGARKEEREGNVKNEEEKRGKKRGQMVKKR